MNTEIKHWIEKTANSTETLDYDEADKINAEKERRVNDVLRQGRSTNWEQLVKQAENESKISLGNLARAARARIAERLPDLALEYARGSNRAMTEAECRIFYGRQ